jgi:hypothetical protein
MLPPPSYCGLSTRNQGWSWQTLHINQQATRMVAVTERHTKPNPRVTHTQPESRDFVYDCQLAEQQVGYEFTSFRHYLPELRPPRNPVPLLKIPHLAIFVGCDAQQRAAEP